VLEGVFREVPETDAVVVTVLEGVIVMEAVTEGLVVTKAVIDPV
jgi:hypothetical protein